MFFRKLGLFTLLLAVCLGIITPLSISAQENKTITATVTVNNLNVRYTPSQQNIFGHDNRVGQLQQGNTVIVQQMEPVDIRRSRDWP